MLNVGDVGALRLLMEFAKQTLLINLVNGSNPKIVIYGRAGS